MQTQQLDVLTIDDEAPIRLYFRKALETCGLTVREAPDGESGLQVVAEAQPRVVLVDLLMPGMPGLELITRLRQVTDVPIIVVTAYADLDSAVESFRSGATDFLTKPVSIADLTRRVQCLGNVW